MKTLLLALLLGSTSCAYLQAHPRLAGVLTCVEGAVLGALPDVAAALVGGSPDWSALGKLEEKHGLDTVLCAAQKLASPAPGSAVNPNLVKNARAYMAARK